MKGKVLPTIAIHEDFLRESIIRQDGKLIDATADRVLIPNLATKIRMLRNKGFDFDNIAANLAHAAAGAHTRQQE